MQNHALKDLTKCRQGQPEDPIWTKTFQNEVTAFFALIPLVPLDLVSLAVLLFQHIGN